MPLDFDNERIRNLIPKCGRMDTFAIYNYLDLTKDKRLNWNRRTTFQSSKTK